MVIFSRIEVQLSLHNTLNGDKWLFLIRYSSLKLADFVVLIREYIIESNGKV